MWRPLLGVESKSKGHGAEFVGTVFYLETDDPSKAEVLVQVAMPAALTLFNIWCPRIGLLPPIDSNGLSRFPSWIGNVDLCSFIKPFGQVTDSCNYVSLQIRRLA